MKEVNLNDKPLSDVVRNITSILGIPKAPSTDDRKGFFIERVSTDGGYYHLLVLKKFTDPNTRESTYFAETDEGSVNPRRSVKNFKFKDIKEMKVFFPNVLIGEEKKIMFEMMDAQSIRKQFEIRRDNYTTTIPSPKKENLQKKTETYKAGDIIFRDGESGEEMFIIQKGKVGIFKHTAAGEVQLAELSVGSFFGEMALMGNPKRSAAAKAVTDTELLVVNKELFEFQLSKIPSWFVTLFKTTIDRLRHANDMIKVLQKQLQPQKVKSEDIAKQRAQMKAAAEEKARAQREEAKEQEPPKPEPAPEKTAAPEQEKDTKAEEPEKKDAPAPATEESEKATGLPPDLPPLD